MSTASGASSTSRPRVFFQFAQHKEGSVPAIRTVQDGPSTEEEFEDDEEDEDDVEIDQLVSTEDEGQPKPAMSASVAGASKPRMRAQKVSVQPPVPLVRLESILDSEIGETMSKEALFVLSAATDAFIKRLAELSHRKAVTMRRSTVNYHDMASAVKQQPELRFLEETIPQPMGLTEAIRLRDAKEKEILEPFMSTPAPPRPFIVSVPPPSHPLSITLPARSISVSASASGSNAPSPRPLMLVSALPVAASASASSMKSSGAKGRRKARYINGEATPPVTGPDTVSVNSAPKPQATVVNDVTTPPTTVAEPADTPAPPPTQPTQPRRMSMREPKPRRRPDEMEDYARPPPAPPTSPVKESVGAIGKTKAPRTRKGKAKVDVPAATMIASTPVLSVNPPSRNGVNHIHANGNGNGMMTTRSRRGSTAVVIPQVMAPQNNEAAMRVDDQKWTAVEPDSGRLSGPGSGFLDGPGVLGRSGLSENPGRTIYSSQRQADVPTTH